jgi:hypothetical protein
VANERLMSVQRLRNLCRDEIDRALVDATLARAAQWRPRARLASKDRHKGRSRARAEPLFRGGSVPKSFGSC